MSKFNEIEEYAGGHGTWCLLVNKSCRVDWVWRKGRTIPMA